MTAVPATVGGMTALEDGRLNEMEDPVERVPEIWKYT